MVREVLYKGFSMALLQRASRILTGSHVRPLIGSAFLASRFSSNFVDGKQTLILRQLFDTQSCTYTYLVAERRSRQALLIDPVIGQLHRDLKLLDQLQLQLIYAVNTHMHADHITASGALCRRRRACRSVIAAASGATADVHVQHGDTVSVGELALQVRATPGHTNGCVTYVLASHGVAFTGDALLIGGCGRTDFQEGDSATLYDSVHRQIFTLPDHTVVLPAHDYHGLTCSSVAEEKKFNPRLTLSKADFVHLMDNLKLDYPKFIDESLPANKVCGLYDLPDRYQSLLDDK